MSSAEFLLKLRDAAQMIADATNEQLEKMAPSKVRHDQKDFDSLKWQTRSGAKGEYEQATKEANNTSEVFQALKQIVQERKGFWQNSSHKYLVHQGNPDIIDRRTK